MIESGVILGHSMLLGLPLRARLERPNEYSESDGRIARLPVLASAAGNTSSTGARPNRLTAAEGSSQESLGPGPSKPLRILLPFRQKSQLRTVTVLTASLSS